MFNIEELFYGNNKEEMFNEYLDDLYKALPNKGIQGYDSTIEFRAELVSNVADIALDCGFLMGLEVRKSLEELDVKLKAISEKYKEQIEQMLKDEKIVIKEKTSLNRH